MVSRDFVVAADLLELDYEFFGGREAWAEKFPEVRDWLGALPDDSTQRQYRDRAYRYFRWLWDNGGDFVGKLPGELVDLQDRAVGKRERYAQLKMLQRYVNNVLKGTSAYKEQFISSVRSFYGCNYVELPRDPRFRIRADRDSVIGSLTREEARTLLLKADMPYRAVYACMLVGFMGRGEFLRFNASKQVRRQIVEGADVIHCDIPGRKKGRPFYSLVGGDGRATSTPSRGPGGQRAPRAA